jgi:D-arabinose 1-dehydrogenase-like Zn-dependent alcohol dehydrogenase
MDWERYLRILKPGGKLCIVGNPPNPLPATGHQLILSQQGIVGSNTGGRLMIREMLDFSARHNIKAQTEPMPMSDANKGVNKVRHNDARYRVVLRK